MLAQHGLRRERHLRTTRSLRCSVDNVRLRVDVRQMTSMRSCHDLDPESIYVRWSVLPRTRMFSWLIPFTRKGPDELQPCFISAFGFQERNSTPSRQTHRVPREMFPHAMLSIHGISNQESGTSAIRLGKLRLARPSQG